MLAPVEMNWVVPLALPFPVLSLHRSALPRPALPRPARFTSGPGDSQDMLLDSAYLRRTDPATALTYFEVDTIARDKLDELLQVHALRLRPSPVPVPALDFGGVLFWEEQQGCFLGIKLGGWL